MASIATETVITSDAPGATEPSCSADVKTGGSAAMERGSATMRVEQQFQSKESTEHPVGQLPTGAIEHIDSGTTERGSCAASHMVRPYEPYITTDTRRQPGTGSGNIPVTLPAAAKRKLDECTQTSQRKMQGRKEHKCGGPAASAGSQISSDVLDLIITNMAGTATSVSIPINSGRVDSGQ